MRAHDAASECSGASLSMVNGRDSAVGMSSRSLTTNGDTPASYKAGTVFSVSNIPPNDLPSISITATLTLRRTSSLIAKGQSSL